MASISRTIATETSADTASDRSLAAIAGIIGELTTAINNDGLIVGDYRGDPVSAVSNTPIPDQENEVTERREPGPAALNLTEADTVIHYDPWWNPAVRIRRRRDPIRR